MSTSSDSVDSPQYSPGRRVLRLLRPHKTRQVVGALFCFLLAAVGHPWEPISFGIGAALALVGMAIRMWAAGHVHKNTELTTTGPYARVRHPLYTGNALIGLGLCVASGLWWSGPLFALLWVVFYLPTIRREDGKLRSSFPERWDEWGSRTPAIIPALGGRPTGERGQWTFRRCLFENGEPIYVVVLCGCLIALGVRF